MQCLGRLFRGLVGCKAAPLVAISAARVLCLSQVAFGLRQPVPGAVGHGLNLRPRLPELGVSAEPASISPTGDAPHQSLVALSRKWLCPIVIGCIARFRSR